ncbi:hypothetical protein [Spiroplasma alleghenense]|uniref:Transmembrane protein n=1 Tax=Spiroplasma alleghenense TaxID=216931 RepID=A0A345Z4R3_9MOLU|nr:hypothetical protein [Spiroplasma alleghenense]AXK51592.1 hypothetical protein SALLE_v1c09220 [Spiroplasma alleghenense]
MSKKLKWKSIRILIAYFLVTALLALTFISTSIITTKNINIKYLPGIEDDFFNGFIVNGLDISDKTILTSKYLLFPFGGKIFASGHNAMWSLITILGIVIYLPLVACRFSPRTLGRKMFSIGGLIALIIIIFLLVGLSFPLDISIFKKVFDEQIYGYFGRDFFNTPELENQLAILRESIFQNFGYSKYIGVNIAAIIISILSFISILVCLLEDYLDIKKSKNVNILNLQLDNSDNKNQQLLQNSNNQQLDLSFKINKAHLSESQINSLRKYFLIIFILTTILSVLIFSFYISITIETLHFVKIPNVNSDYFNGFINENGENYNDIRFEQWLLITSYGGLSNLNEELMISITYFPISAWVLIAAFEFGKSQKMKFTGQTFFWYSIILLIIMVNIIIQFSFFLNPKIYEIQFRKNLFFYFEQNYLIKTVGQDTLDFQIRQSALGLKSLYAGKYNPVAITALVLSSLIVILTFYSLCKSNLSFIRKNN